MDPKLNKWLTWLKIIEGEVSGLIIGKYIFHEVQTMINNNPQLHKPSSFYDYLSTTYISHTIIGLRRQLKCNKESVSVARLFSELIESPKTFTRSYYVSLYRESRMRKYADQDFERFASPGATHIDSAFIISDLAQLQEISCRCEDFADKRIAHRDTREPSGVPTFNEVDACIDFLEKLYVKYYSLFHATSMESLLPVWQYDWKAVFRTAWITDDERTT